MIHIGPYIEELINWLTNNFGALFSIIKLIVISVVDSVEWIFMFPPFYVVILLITFLAWKRTGLGVTILTLRV